MRCAHFELFNFELRIRNLKFKIQKFKIAGEAENNSKFKTQNSKLPKATIQNSKLKTQNCQRQQFKTQNSKLKIAKGNNSKLKIQNSKLKMITPEYREGLDDLASHYKEVLTLLGEDPEREGLQKTPMRVAKAMQVLTRGYSQDPHKVLTDALFKEDYNQMVLVKDIDVFSLCEHHMLPFYGKAHVAYIPNGYITGLSKIARVVDIFSHRLQVQERLTQQIRECIEDTLHPLGVMVVIEAKHMCMQMRGVEKQSSITMTSDFSGAFEQAKTRQELMNLINSNSHKF